MLSVMLISIFCCVSDNKDWFTLAKAPATCRSFTCLATLGIKTIIRNNPICSHAITGAEAMDQRALKM
jgi:hypothetical protein